MTCRYCDRCGRNITISDECNSFIVKLIRIDNKNLFGLYDLCQDCANKFKRFLEDEVELVDEKE